MKIVKFLSLLFYILLCKFNLHSWAYNENRKKRKCMACLKSQIIIGYKEAVWLDETELNHTIRFYKNMTKEDFK